MLENIKKTFSLFTEKEDFFKVLESIESSIPFKGTNLWILIFAIFIASLGLNVNSTAVIIGAMLISPLMGPLIGVGFSVAVNHPQMLKNSLINFGFSFAVGLATSTVYFLISPLSEAHSEILARTSPNIYDVFIAFFGGAAGMLANGSKLKGNVIPGVAIATALMPPLCTAGYGIATGQFNYFFGATYLYIINSVYIAVSTFIMAKVLNYPEHHFLESEKLEKRSRNVMWILSFLTLIPSLYFGYLMVNKNNFESTANRFINNEATFPNNFLLKKDISYENKKIQLTYGGQKLEEKDLKQLLEKSKAYGLEKVKITVQQGFNFSTQNQPTLLENDKILTSENISKLIKLQDSMRVEEDLSKQIFRELKTQNPDIKGFSISYVLVNSDSLTKKTKLLLVESSKKLSDKQKTELSNYLKIRVKNDSVKVIVSD